MVVQALATGREGLPAREHKIFRDSGYFTLVDDQSGQDHDAFVGFKFGLSTRATHYQDDSMTFDLVLGGQSIVEDSGFLDHAPSDMNSFYRSAAAHTTVSFGDADRPRDIAKTALEDYTESPGGVSVTASLRTSEGHSFVRELQFQYSGPALVVRDRYQRTSGDGACLLFHYAPEVDASVEGTSVRLLTPGGEFRQTLVSRADMRLLLLRGETQPAIQGWISRNEGVKEPRTVLRLDVRGSGGEVISVFAPESAAIEPILAHAGVTGLMQ